MIENNNKLRHATNCNCLNQYNSQNQIMKTQIILCSTELLGLKTGGPTME